MSENELRQRDSGYSNQLVNEFYTRFLLKIDIIPQDIVLLLDIDTTFFKNWVLKLGSYWY